MTQAQFQAFSSDSNHPLVSQIRQVTAPIHHKMGSWNIISTSTGAMLTMTKCGLGDAGFLPQALLHGGLELRRLNQLDGRYAEPLKGRIMIGEIFGKRESGSMLPVVSSPSKESLTPEQAMPQPFSILIHIFIPTSRAVATKFSQRLEIILGEINTTLQFKSWPGMIPHSETGKPRATINLHLATHPDFPLSPYEFESTVLPLLKEIAKRVKQDGLLIRFDNPSTNLVLYCASQETILPKGQPCTGGHLHPG